MKKKKKTIKKTTAKKGKMTFKNPTLKKLQLKFRKSSMGEKILSLIMVGMIFLLLVAIAFFIYIVISAPNFTEEGLYASDASIIYYADGEELGRVGTKNREKVTYDEIPEIFIDALLATEDSRYLEHGGIDLARFLKASFGQLLGNSNAGGGSTLTMQVVKQTFTDDTATGIKGIIRKFTDIYMAVFKIEKKYTKEQIIEFYVNIPYLGAGTDGVEQAAQTYFGKSIGEVSLAEAATIVGLFQAPDAFDPFNHPEKAENRRNQVLTLMKRHDYITDEEYEIAKNISVESLLIEYDSADMEIRGLLDTVIKEVRDRTKQDPYQVAMKIYSTFVKEKQQVINDINNGTTQKWTNDKIQTGIAVVDVETGGITAIGAGRNKKTPFSWNYAVQNKRHPGSTAKPMFDYGPAIEYLNWGTGQMIIDDTHGYSGGGTLNNWDYGHKGILTIKQALAASRNTTALQAFQATPNKKIAEFVSGMNLHPEYDTNDFLHEAHSIGAYEGESPLTTAAAYATFARGGIYIEPHSFTKVEFVDTGDVYTVTPEKRTVMKDSTAYLINMILRFAVTNGDIGVGRMPGTEVASKTGTSSVDTAKIKALGLSGKNVIQDSWQVVYSPDYVIATWIGYDETTKENYLTNGAGGTIRRSLSNTLTSILEPNSKFKRPSSVVTANIELETNPLQLASEFTPANLKSTEYFRKGTAPSEVSTRFSKLDKPTNLKVSTDIVGVSLNWNPISEPDAINSTYLTNYFNVGYGKWANKYLNQRFNYNNNFVGAIGYQVYLNTNGNLTNLGWTAKTNFTYNNFVPAGSTFIVKSAYSIFKDNMSDPVEIKIAGEVGGAEWKVELLGKSCVSQDEFNNIQKYVKVTENGLEVPTSEYEVRTTCTDDSNESTNCNSSDNLNVTHTVIYKDISKIVKRVIKEAC